MFGSDRGVSPAVGVVLVVVVVVALAAVVGAALRSAATAPERPPRATFSASVSADGRVVLVHRGGDPVDADRLRVRIAVDGEGLAHQPPVPFFAARGFESGPTGPFNRRADSRWTAGERASLTVASTNAPAVEAGSRVRVRVYAEGSLLWEGSAVAGPAALDGPPSGPRGQSAPARVASAAAPAGSSPSGARATVVMATVGA